MRTLACCRPIANTGGGSSSSRSVPVQDRVPINPLGRGARSFTGAPRRAMIARAMTAQWFLRLTVMARGPDCGAAGVGAGVLLQSSCGAPEGRRLRGRAEYRQFLDAHPDNVEARSNLGVVLVNLGRLRGCHQRVQGRASIAALESRRRVESWPRVLQGVQLEERSRHLVRAECEPDNLQARYLAADCQLRLGRPAEAINSSSRWSIRRGRSRACRICSGWRTWRRSRSKRAAVHRPHSPAW